MASVLNPIEYLEKFTFRKPDQTLGPVELEIWVANGLDKPHLPVLVGTFNTNTELELSAVRHWLIHSNVYVWPVCGVRNSSDFSKQEVVLYLDGTLVDALNVSGQGASTTYSLAHTAAKALKLLVAEVKKARRVITIDESPQVIK